MKLSIFLFNDNVKSFKDVIRPKCFQGDDAYAEISTKKTLPYKCKAYLQTNKGKQPTWYAFINGFFNLASFQIENTSNSFVLLISVKKRIFAATFGYGSSAIDRAKLEPNFGLKVTLNTINPNQIDTLDTRNIDLVTKQRRTHLNVGSSVAQFGVNEMIDWVRFVSGRPSSKEVARKLSGSDSLSIIRDEKIENLGKLCEVLLTSYNSIEYKKQFGFIDYLRALSKKDPQSIILDEKLVDLLSARETNQITVAHPEIPDTSVVEYAISMGNNKVTTDEVTLDSVYKLLDQLQPDMDYLNKAFIIGLDGESKPMTGRSPLKDYIVCEILDANSTYVHSLGQWFRIDGEYVKIIRQRIQDIPDCTCAMGLPMISRGEGEGSYNERVASTKGWLLLDKKMFTFGNHHNKIEAADILSPMKEFICVKKMASSATLSHLFAQGSVSAKLLRNEPQYEEELGKQYSDHWPTMDFKVAGTPTFVYAIPTEKSGPLYQCMFFFSIINLLDHIATIRSAGFNVALCKVEYDPSSYKKTAVKKAKRRRALPK